MPVSPIIYDAAFVDALVKAEVTARVAAIANRGIDVTLGPFCVNDLPANVSTAASLGYFNSATTLSQNSYGIRMRQSGRLVGIMIIADADRTAGTATARIRVNGTTSTGLTASLDASNRRSNSAFSSSAGATFTAGQFIGANIVTSDFAPITANALVYLTVRLDDFS